MNTQSANCMVNIYSPLINARAKYIITCQNIGKANFIFFAIGCDCVHFLEVL